MGHRNLVVEKAPELPTSAQTYLVVGNPAVLSSADVNGSQNE